MSQTERAPAGPVRPRSAWEVVHVCRHPERPYALDYIWRLAPDFLELHGDRVGGDDPALVAGLGTLNDRSIMFIGQQKGRDLEDRIAHNWGMMHPEGYRKAIRLAKHAAKFGFPVVCLIDTPGAFPGAAAEQRGMASAIGSAIFEWFGIASPVLAAIIGEGGSGGALGIGVADHVVMLENSIFSVASPEAAAAIVWRDLARKEEAANQLRLTASELLAMGLIDEIVLEPSEGAHRNYDAVALALGEIVSRQMDILCRIPLDELLQRRHERYRHVDVFGRSW